MWKRDEAVKPPQPATSQTSGPASTAGKTESVPPKERRIVNSGKSLVIKGELSGSEDLTIEGQVEGKIELRQNVLTIGPNGRIKAQVAAKAIVIEGQVTGDITASERIEIRDHFARMTDRGSRAVGLGPEGRQSTLRNLCRNRSPLF